MEGKGNPLRTRSGLDICASTLPLAPKVCSAGPPQHTILPFSSRVQLLPSGAQAHWPGRSLWPCDPEDFPAAAAQVPSLPVPGLCRDPGTGLSLLACWHLAQVLTGSQAGSATTGHTASSLSPSTRGGGVAHVPYVLQLYPHPASPRFSASGPPPPGEAEKQYRWN